MNMEELKNKHFKNIICLTTVDGNDALRARHLASNVLRKRLDEGDLLLFVFGGKETKGLFPSSVRNESDPLMVFDLHLTCVEDYTLLAQKTYDFIDFCSKNLSFDRLYKGDDTKEITEKFCDFDHKFKVDFMGVSEQRKRIRLENGTSYWDRHFLAQEMYKCRVSTFRKWASRRSITVDASEFDGGVWYSGWKPYGISKKFAKAISINGKTYAKLYCDKLGGCEDHMIGKMFTDLKIRYDLKIQ